MPRTKMSMSGCHYWNVKMIVLVATLVALLCYPAFIHSAVIRLENDAAGEREQRDFASLYSQRVRRAAENVKEEEPKRNCYNTACGWAVYNPLTRTVEYFMKNTCECPDKSYKCVRAGDDLSASAYVYRCRQNTTADDIESPEDAN